MTRNPVLLILDALACYRLTRLVCEDVILEPARRRLIGSVESGGRALDGTKIIMAARPRLAEFLSCAWCVSPWCAGSIIAAQAWIPAITIWPIAVAALSAVAGLLSTLV